VNSETFVSNSSPLIALERIGRLDILAAAYGHVLIPPAVRQEVGAVLGAYPWIVERRLSQPINAHVVAANLGAGESEAISLAIELRANQIVLDDEPARKLALSLDLPLTGTLGVLLAAKHAGILTELRPTAEALLATGFRLDPKLLDMILAKVGEH
jgi:predicted nucleic acid-binding protein